MRHDDRPAPRRTSSLPGCAMLGHDCAATRTAGRPTWRAALAHSRAPRRTPRLSTLNRAAPATTTSIILSRSCPMRGTRGLSCGGPADCRDTWKQAAPASKPRKLVTSIDVLGLQSSRPQSTGRAGRRPPFARGRARTRSCPPPPPPARPPRHRTPAPGCRWGQAFGPSTAAFCPARACAMAVHGWTPATARAHTGLPAVATGALGAAPPCCCMINHPT